MGLLLYLVLVLAVSLRSTPRTLRPGQALHFCGLYLDCHTYVVADSYAVRGPARDGTWEYVVSMRFGNEARRATLSVRTPRVDLVDAGSSGVLVGAVAGPTGFTLAPGMEVATEFVFTTRRPLDDPRLRVAVGGFVERVSESLLVGDENSLGHARTDLALRRVTGDADGTPEWE